MIGMLELGRYLRRCTLTRRPARSRLIDLLLVSLHEGPLDEVEAAWDEEVERRLGANDRGVA